MNSVRNLISDERRARMRESLTRVRTVSIFDKLGDRVNSFSPGDTIIFYTLIVLVCIATLSGLYSLEKSLLVQVPAYGGTLTEGEVGSPQFINPLLAITDADRDLSALAYAGLMGISGSGDLVPVLAESYTESPDGKTYTFTLRPNAKFSDGTSVTANDVVFTIQKAQDSGLKSPEYADWSGIGVEALDAHTVEFTLQKAYAPFLELTTLGILPAHLWQNISDEEFSFSTLETSPVGAGPFKVTSVSRNSSGLIQGVSFAQNKYYALGRPYLNGINFNFYSNSEDLANAVSSGAVESAYDVPSDTELTAPYARIFGVFWNPSQNKVFSRIEVRKALSLAIDRQNIVENVLSDHATAIMGPVPPGGLVKQVPVQFGDYTEAAATVLETSGWLYDGSARIWKNAGAKQTLEGITLRTSNVPELKNVATAVKTDLEKLGIPVTIELYESGDLSQNVIRSRRYEALLYGEVIGRDQDLYAFWDSREQNDPGLNVALYANKTVDTLLEDARSSTDQGTRTADLQKIENAIASDYPAAFLYAPDFVYTIPKNLHGISLPQIITPSDRFATVASWYRVTDTVWPFFANNKK